MAIGIELGRALMRTQDRIRQEREQAEEQARRERLDRESADQRQIQMAAMEASLRGQGIIPESEAQPITLPGSQVQSMVPEIGGAVMQGPTPPPVPTTAMDTTRYKPLGTTGRVQDQTQTPEAKARAQKAAELAAQRQEESGLQRDLQSALAGDEGAKARVLAKHPALANTLFKPDEPKAYQPTTRAEAMADADERARIAARYRAPSGGSGGAGAVKPPSEGERRGAALLRVAEDAFPVLQRAKAPSRPEAVLARMGMNEGLSQERQLVEQSARQFVTSYLYVVSGATASPQEVDNLVAQIVPSPGDKPDTLKRKQEAQRAMLQAIREVSGRAAGPAPSTAPSNPWR